MSTAKLNVWVTAVGEPCKIDMAHQWFVHVLHCDGQLLNWCGKNFTNLKTKCGHLEEEIPPGCYMVCATWSPAAVVPKPTSLGNHITHIQVVRANCGDHVCVTLFPPTLHHCGVWWLLAVKEAIDLKHLPQNAVPAAQEVLAAGDKLMKLLPADGFTAGLNRIGRPPKG
jgi:hypothetical protein